MSGENNHMYGRTHTPESKAQMSDSKTGANNPMYGRTGALNPMYGRIGSNHPNFSISPANAKTVNVYSVDNVLVGSFSSMTAAANWLNIPRTTFRGYLSSGKVWNNQYRFVKSMS